MARARTSPGVDYNALVKLLKKLGDEKHSVVANEMGVTPSQLDMMTFHRARVEAGIVDEAPATAKSVRRLRDTEKCRWEEIAARTDLGVTAVKNLYEEAGGDSSEYVGRGRNWNGVEEDTPKRSTTKRSSAKASQSAPAKRGASKRSSAKASSTKRSSKKASAAPTRARTRAQRAARDKGNPS